MNKENHFYWGDCLRLFAVFSVVYLHPVMPLCYVQVNSLSWWFGNISTAFFKICVPLLFMLTGFLLLGKQEPLEIYFKKRVSRLLVPLIAWAVIYRMWSVFYLHRPGTFLSEIRVIYNGETYYHFWFLYALVGLYLIIPVLRVFIRNADKREQFYFVGLWFSAIALIPFFEKLCFLFLERKISIGIELKMASGFSGYLMLGYLLGHLKVTREKAWLAFAVYVFTAAAAALATFYETKHYGQLTQNYYLNESVTMVVTAGSFFLWFKHLAEQPHETKPFLKRAVSALSPLTLGIYLIHPLIYEILSGKTMFSFLTLVFPSLIAATLLQVFWTGLISCLIVLLFSKLPFLRKLV